jgi:hypothetical protein
MNKFHIAIFIAISSIICTTSIAATPAKPAAPAKPVATIKVQETAITYEEAEQHVGDRIIVHTVNKTTRTGTLTKFSKTMLTVNVEVSGGTVEFTFDKASVAGLAVPMSTTTPPDTGTPSAKKN